MESTPCTANLPARFAPASRHHRLAAVALGTDTAWVNGFLNADTWINFENPVVTF